LIRYASIFTLACLTGCGLPYPVYKTLQPASQLTVFDRHGQPIVGAEVTLISRAYPSYMATRQDKYETRISDAQGVTMFESKNEWRIETLVIHGSETFYWSWCVQKPYYATYHSTGEFVSLTSVQLLEGQSTPCNELRD